MICNFVAGECAGERKLAILTLELRNYRNFNHYTLDTGSDPVVIIGTNGAGKTNILEAISLFTFGRGLKDVRFNQLINNNSHNAYCSVISTQRTKIGHAQVSLEFHGDNHCTRDVLFNNRKVPIQDLHKLTDVFWFSHDMHKVIGGGKQARRSFFDKFTYSLFHTHAKVTSQYNQLIKRRMEVLLNDAMQSSALEHLETQIARCVKVISNNRTQYLEKLNLQISHLPPSFLPVQVRLDEAFDDEDHYIQLLRKNRKKDSMIKRTSSGVHLANFDLFFNKNTQWYSTEIASNGEQKAALISIFFAHIHLYIASCGYTPIILLDEFFAHLDHHMVQAILHFLLGQQVQFWITGVDMHGIESLEQYANVIDLCLE